MGLKTHKTTAWLGLITISTSGCGMGPTELLIVLGIVVLLFGATRLPQLGRAFGETIRSFRSSAGVDTLQPPENGSSVGKIQEAVVEESESEVLRPRRHDSGDDENEEKRKEAVG